MSLQFSTSVRNALLDAIETTVGTSAVIKLRTGSAPADCGTADSGTVLATFSLASDWAAAASSGTKALNSLPVTDSSADGSGDAGHFRLYASDGTTCHLQGTVTATGGGGDMTASSVTITSGQPVNITSFTLTAPGA